MPSALPLRGALTGSYPINKACFDLRLKRATMWKAAFLFTGEKKKKKGVEITVYTGDPLYTRSSNAEQEGRAALLDLAMCDDSWRSDGLNGI